MNGKEVIYVIDIVEKLLARKILSREDYHLFITEERHYGTIEGEIKNGDFFIKGVEISDNLKSPECRMYRNIQEQANKMLKEDIK